VNAIAETPSETAEAGLPNGRERLIATALRMFAERGFDAVSVRDIAKASGVSIGLIRHHFGSKEGLREAVDQEFMRQFEEGIAQAAERWLENLEDYGAWLDAATAGGVRNWHVSRQYFRRALLEESDWGAALFQRFYELVKQWVEKTDARGAIAEDVDRQWLPYLIMFLELGGVLLDPHMRRIIGRSSFSRDLWRSQHRAYTSLIRHGIEPSESSKVR
jgi:AcrR family transcriptional regulator